ncbi:MAG: REP element-mobilizing transposase RayT [Burkholderiaceae bacterium]|jgi:REP element-mobilizing transposase RayT
MTSEEIPSMQTQCHSTRETLCAQSFRLESGEQFEGRIKSDDSEKELSEYLREVVGGALWSPSCFAVSCDGAPMAVIRQYIEQQQAPH